MLPISGSISPPSVISDYADGLGTFPDILSTEFRINGLITYRNAHRNASRHVSIFIVLYHVQVLRIALRHASSHQSPQSVVDRREKLRIRGQFRAHHELGLVRSLHSPRAIRHIGSVIREIPSVASAQRTCQHARRGVSIKGLMRTRPEKQVHIRVFVYQILRKSAPSRRILRRRHPDVRAKGLRKHKQGHLLRICLQRVPSCQLFSKQFHDLTVLCALRNCLQFLIRVEIRLCHKHFQPSGIRSLTVVRINDLRAHDRPYYH